MPRSEKNLGAFSPAGDTTRPGTERDSSSISLTPLRSMVSEVIAVIEIGTLRMDSVRFWAVTTISSSIAVSSCAQAGAAVARAAPAAPAMSRLKRWSLVFPMVFTLCSPLR